MRPLSTVMTVAVSALIMVILYGKASAYTVRIGMMLPVDHPHLKPMFGYETSAAAVSLAIERAQREQLLPGANFSFVVRNCQCQEDIAAGHTVEMMKAKLIDVLIGSPCAQPFISAVIASYYNVPLLNWAVTTAELADAGRFETVSRTIGSASKIGRVLAEVLSYFHWRSVAIFYTDDNLNRKCQSVALGTLIQLPKYSIQNVLLVMVESDEPSDEEIERFLERMKSMARVAIVCMDQGIRRFMLRAQERGMTSEEYVYIIPEYIQNENLTDLWTSAKNLDGRNVEAKGAFNASFFIEMQLSNTEDLHLLKKRIPEKMREPPFYYLTQKADEYYGSLYSPFLHDSVYLYALALNKTLSRGDNLTDGRAVIDATKNTRFLGASGIVFIDDSAGREPSFLMKTLDKNRRWWNVAKIHLFKDDGDTIELLVPELSLWDPRNGFRPTGQPRCGWQNDLCDETHSQLTMWLLVGTVSGLIFLVLVVSCLAFIIKKRLLSNEVSQMLWRINYRDLVLLKDLQDRNQASFQTINSNVSEETAEVMLKGIETVAHYRGVLVWMRAHNASIVLSSDKDHIELNALRNILHENLNKFVGLCIDSSKPISLWNYCSKGSLEDVLLNSNIKLDWFFKYALIKDLAAGLEHLHSSILQSHGHLKSSNCLIDSRWVLKITDFGLNGLREGVLLTAKDKVWMAPELLRMFHPPASGTQKGDVYSYAIIMAEIISRDKPFAAYEEMTNEEVVAKVRLGSDPIFRPKIGNEKDADVDPQMISLMRDCWTEDPERRPEMKEVRGAVKQMGRGRTTNLMDHVLKMMEAYGKNLEIQANERTRQISEEAQKSDVLLYRMLPKIIADRLKCGQTVEPESYEAATLFFSNIAGFDVVALRSTPFQIIAFLNELYTFLDAIIEDYDAYKVESVNDGYLIVSGLPNRNGNKHASEIADLALRLQLAMGSFFVPSFGKEKFELRCGVHTGPVVAAVVGLTLPRYCMFGDTVNVANRIETNGKASCIHISSETNRYLTQVIGGYVTKPRGEIILKGKGVMFTHWLLGKKVSSITDNTEHGADGDYNNVMIRESEHE